jgi:hypothetical protein
MSLWNNGYLVIGFAWSLGLTVLLLFWLRAVIDRMAIQASEVALEAAYICEQLEL